MRAPATTTPMRLRIIGVPLICAMAIASGGAQTAKPLPKLREQAEIQQQWLKLRLERVLPSLMRRQRIQMWLVICREYNEDPAFLSLVSPTVFAARRRTIYVFFDRGAEKGVERIALGGGSNGGLYTVYRDPEVENREIYGEGQWVLLKRLIDERKPSKIAIDVSDTHAFSDGLSAAEREKLETVLGPQYSKRIVRAENLPLEYIETRLPEMAGAMFRFCPRAGSRWSCQATTAIPEWGGKGLFVGLEEDAAVDERGRISWILRRQTEYHLIR